MSRYVEYDGWDEYEQLAYGRWERNSRVVWESKRGQVVLRELAAALVALPSKELAYDTFCERAGESPEELTCVLGAYARYKGIPIAEMAYLDGDWEDDHEDINEQAQWAKEHLGMTFTMAWMLIERNDEAFKRHTPAQRYKAMLEFVRSKLREKV